jgi:hypothetical protein
MERAQKLGRFKTETNSWTKNLGSLFFGFLTGLALALLLPLPSFGAENFVYNIIRGIDLGNPGESPQRDYYVNLGTSQGVRTGDELEVLRRIPSYDATNQKIYRDITFPIARLKVIHAENNAAIARLDEMVDPAKIPVLEPHAVMLGDLVRRAR